MYMIKIIRTLCMISRGGKIALFSHHLLASQVWVPLIRAGKCEGGDEEEWYLTSVTPLLV